MDDVGAADRREVFEHAIGELVDDVGQRLLGQVMRPGLDEDDLVVGLDVDDRGETLTIGAGVGDALDAALGEGRDHLADVDVHPAAVARTGLEQGRGVQGDDGDTTHLCVQRS